MISTDIFKTKAGVILISIIWGLGIAALFKQVCKGKDCMKFTAPNHKDINNNTFLFNNKCFKYSPDIINCNHNSNIVDNHL